MGSTVQQKFSNFSLAQRPSSRPATLPTPLTAAWFIRVNTAIAPRRTPILKIAVLDNAEFEVPIILGCVIAHEVGHLLLGSSSHSGSGIMQGHWKRGQIRKAMTGNLPFTPEQVKLIQASTFARVGRISGTQVTDEPLTKFPCRPGHEPAACISGTCASILKRGVLASDHDERLQKAAV